MKKLSLLFLPFLFVSCATITRGVHDKLYVQSEPSGAEARLSTGEKRVTPAKFIKNRRENFTVTVSKAGYIAQTVKVESRTSATGAGAMAGNIVAGGIVGVVVDASTGAMYSLYPNPVVVHLIPITKPSKPSKVPPSKTRATRNTRETSAKPKSKSTSKPAPKAKPSPTPENLPPIQSTPVPEASPTPENPPTLQSVPSPAPETSSTP